MQEEEKSDKFFSKLFHILQEVQVIFPKIDESTLLEK